jgi:hypothetical protein
MSLFAKPKGAYKRNVSAPQGLFTQILITKKIPISINNIGNSIKETLEKAIAFQVEGKCIVEGYIKPNSVDIVTFSSGLVSGSTVMFEVVFQCYVCSPVEGMHINCIAKHINKAGIRAEVNETPSPVVIFIARDHNYASPLFAQIKENDDIKIRVIGQRFELNDKYISIIAELIDTTQQPMMTTKKAPLSSMAVKNTPQVPRGKITAVKKISIANEISKELGEEIMAESKAASLPVGLAPVPKELAPVPVGLATVRKTMTARKPVPVTEPAPKEFASAPKELASAPKELASIVEEPEAAKPTVVKKKSLAKLKLKA